MFLFPCGDCFGKGAAGSERHPGDWDLQELEILLVIYSSVDYYDTLLFASSQSRKYDTLTTRPILLSCHLSISVAVNQIYNLRLKAAQLEFITFCTSPLISVESEPWYSYKSPGTSMEPSLFINEIFTEFDQTVVFEIVA